VKDRFFINGHSILASSVFLYEITQKKEEWWLFDTLLDAPCFEVIVKKASLESACGNYNLFEDLTKKHLEGESFIFESSSSGTHCITTCSAVKLTKDKKGLISFGAVVTGPITFTAGRECN
jgi:hypothetical protein